MTMWNQLLGSILLALCFFIPARGCLAKELLFQAEPVNYDHDRKLGEAYRTEFNPRMFPHRTWHQRLAYSSSEQDVDETLEIYSKPDGSRWLSHQRAKPSLTVFIWRRIVEGAKFDLKEKLDSVSITSHEVLLPAEVANELDRLWRTMLPGVRREQVPRTLAMHAPIFDAWVRKGHSVAAGRIPMAAYDTPIYRAFVDVVTDLREVAHRGGGLKNPIFARLPDKIRALRAKLEKP
jgi:hypothetical protein